VDRESPEENSQNQIDYVGNELELFEQATNWKRYFASRLKPYLNGDVLEVGAGFGANVPYLFRSDLKSWVSLEPDLKLCEEYRRRQAEGIVPPECQLTHGTIANLPDDATFDSILYIDVLEHIEADEEEFELAYARLNVGGHLAILCPALGYLYSPFDKAIGHFRRYNKSMYRKLSARQPCNLEYLDSVGMFASVANKLLLRQSVPTAKQIALWDRLFVRLSLVTDTLTLRKVGKTILGVWQKSE
jgi:SAM-dependent methyltransferase